MEIFRFALSVRLRHPTAKPDEITAALGMCPTREWNAGEPRSTPNGQPLSGTNRGTYWVSKSLRGEDNQLLSAFDFFLTSLESRSVFLDKFRDTGGSIEFFLGWFTSQRSGGVTIDPTLLGRLATLGIEFGLDVYPAP